MKILATAYSLLYFSVKSLIATPGYPLNGVAVTRSGCAPSKKIAVFGSTTGLSNYKQDRKVLRTNNHILAMRFCVR